MSEFEPQHKEVSRHVTSGLLNSGVVQVVKVLCQLGSVIILSRLLSPSDFGVMAMVAPVVALVILFQDMGLSQSTVQKATLDHEEVNIFFWINIGVGLVLAILMVAISPLVGWYYKDPRVVTLTEAMALLVVIGSFGTQHGAILRRRMQFRSMALLDMLGAVSGLVSTTIFALVWKNYWALYFGLAVAMTLPVLTVWRIVRWRPTMFRRKQGMRGLLHFGAGVTAYNFAAFFARNMDNVLIGRYWGEEVLGLYDRAYKLLLFPLQRVVDPMSVIIIPLLSRMMDEPERYRDVYRKALAQITLLMWPAIIWVISAAPILIPFLLGKKWLGTVSIFQPLAFAALFQVLNAPAGWLFISQGRGGDYARWGLVNAATCIAAFVVGLPYGAAGVAIAYAASECIRTVFIWWYATRKGHVRLINALSAILPQFTGGVAVALSFLWLHNMGYVTSFSWLLLSGILAYGIFILVVCLFPVGRQTLEVSVTILKRTLFQRASSDG